MNSLDGQDKRFVLNADGLHQAKEPLTCATLASTTSTDSVQLRVVQSAHGLRLPLGKKTHDG